MFRAVLFFLCVAFFPVRGFFSCALLLPCFCASSWSAAAFGFGLTATHLFQRARSRHLTGKQCTAAQFEKVMEAKQHWDEIEKLRAKVEAWAANFPMPGL